jgi:hypothetical protein
LPKIVFTLCFCLAALLAVAHKDSIRGKPGLAKEGTAALPAASFSPSEHSCEYTAGTAPIAAVSVPSLPFDTSSSLSTASSYVPSMEKVANPVRVNNYPLPKRIDMGYRSEYRSYHRPGYAKLAVLFAPEYQMGHFLPLVDVRGIALTDGTFGGNLGFIGRFLPSTQCLVYGFNVFYDVRGGKFGTYHQMGGGFEVLAKRWEVHANAYLPVGLHKYTRKCVFDDYIGNYRAVRKRYEFAEYAFDATAGYYIVNGKNFQLYASAGPYCFFGKFHTSAFGGMAALRPQYRDYLAVEFSVTHDHIFNTLYQASVVFSIPLYNYSSRIKHKRGPCGVANRQIYQPIDRDIILLRRCCWTYNW